MADVIPTTITFDSLIKSGVIPAREKSGIERAFERLRESKDKGEFHAVEAIKGVRQVAESGAIGAILGGIHASRTNGLDMKVGTPAAGQTQRVIPLDAAIMALGFVGGVFMAAEPSGVGKTAMNASAAAAAVFLFRQTNDFMSKNEIKKNAAAGTLKANPNAGLPGVISKASFAGEADGSGWAPGSKSWRASMHGGASMAGEDPIVVAARNL